MPVIAHQRIVAGSGRPSLSDLVAAFPTSLFPLAGRQDGRMAMSETELLALLRELDDPERLERPLNYDRAAASLAFGGLVRRLEADFGVQCEFEQDMQDSSEYGRVRVPAQATICGTRIVVCVSKFGSLAEACADNPGAFLGTEEAREEGGTGPHRPRHRGAGAGRTRLRERPRGTTGERLRGPQRAGVLRSAAHLVDAVLRHYVIRPPDGASQQDLARDGLGAIPVL